LIAMFLFRHAAISTSLTARSGLQNCPDVTLSYTVDVRLKML
jgi:hypothetical protein